MSYSPSKLAATSHRTNSRAFFTCLLLLLAAFGLTTLFIYREYRHQNLNCQLIAAIDAMDADECLSLIAEGAGGDARKNENGPISMQVAAAQLWNRIMHHGRSGTDGAGESALACYYERIELNGMEDSDLARKKKRFASDEHVPLAILDSGSPLNEHFDVGFSALYRAAEFHQHQVVKHMAELGADVNLEFAGSGAPLMVADGDDTATLLSHGAKADTRDPLGYSSYYRADVKKVNLLADAGVSMETRDFTGSTPLSDSCQYQTDEVVIALLKRGAKVNVRDCVNGTPFLYASERCRLETVKALAAAGARVSQIDDDHMNGLMQSIYNEDYRVFDWELSLGLDINARNRLKDTALGLAIAGLKGARQSGESTARFVKIIAALRSHGAREPTHKAQYNLGRD